MGAWMEDLISRREALDTLSIGKEILNRVMDDIDVVGIDREKYSWGLGLIESSINDIEELPSAQPEQRWIPCSERLPYAEYGESPNVYCYCYDPDLGGKWAQLLYYDGGVW